MASASLSPSRAATAAPKRPRRTAERILEVALDLFNRFGEPNVSTTLISAELRISPGNLYYHYASKDELINRLFDRYEAALHDLLEAAPGVANVEDAWLFFHMLFELIWTHRFLYRDLNDLVSNNRRLELRVKSVLDQKTQAVRQVLAGMNCAGAMDISPDAAEPAATAMVVVLTYWLSFEYARDPRHALEPESAGPALLRGAFHVMSLLMPYLEAGQRAHLMTLLGLYGSASAAPTTSPTPRPHRERADMRG